jgi:putative endonuclease
MHRQPAVYILANQKRGTLYTGVTANLLQRIYQHRNPDVEGSSKRYKTHRLIYFELHESILAAITREKQIKKLNRDWKIKLIISTNPDWRDLYPEII